MNKNVNYGNWVPEKMLALCYVAAAVLGIAAYVTGPVLHLAIPAWILGISFGLRFAWSMAFTCTSVMNCLPSAKAT